MSLALQIWISEPTGHPGRTMLAIQQPQWDVEESEKFRQQPSTTPYGDQGTASAKTFQSCPTLCDPIDGSPPASPIPGILQARILEWAAISFSNAWKWKVKVKSFSRVQPSATPWTAAHQAPPSMGFSRQEYWSGVPLPSPDQGTKSLKTQTVGCWPQIAEIHMKEMILVSPDSCIFPCIENG